ncbi:glycolipid transfer protein domain-containing protein [Endogone sp. FLAS-F59071]|nr:glycolipid transfer protein domain-containing protein [Endogone sp. FLAS-F59071]|eukprot:RUS15595.1 glycolipid transfer protein domain-containing protein [Endogone sp. FLAS-F59071]
MIMGGPTVLHLPKPKSNFNETKTIFIGSSSAASLARIGLEFTSQALRRSVSNPEEELSVSFTESYKNTLSKHHNFMIKPVFMLAMNACPSRADFYTKLGAEGEGFSERMGEWLTALEFIVADLNRFYIIEHPAYAKF